MGARLREAGIVGNLVSGSQAAGNRATNRNSVAVLCNAVLVVNALEITDHAHAEIVGRRKRGRTHGRRNRVCRSSQRNRRTLPWSAMSAACRKRRGRATAGSQPTSRSSHFEHCSRVASPSRKARLNRHNQTEPADADFVNALLKAAWLSALPSHLADTAPASHISSGGSYIDNASTWVFSLYAAHGADAHLFQRRVIQLASIVLSHLPSESDEIRPVNKNVQLLMG